MTDDEDARLNVIADPVPNPLGFRPGCRFSSPLPARPDFCLWRSQRARRG